MVCNRVLFAVVLTALVSPLSAQPAAAPRAIARVDVPLADEVFAVPERLVERSTP